MDGFYQVRRIVMKKIFIFTKAINGCQSVAGLNATSVNVKRLVNPYRGLSTQNRPAKSKCVEVNCEGSFILKCLNLSIKYTHINGVLLINTLKRVNFLPQAIWFRSMRLRLLSKCARRGVFTEAFSFFSLCFFKLATSFFPFSRFSFVARFLTLIVQ